MMRIRASSPILLVVGMIVGLLAMWASACPLGATGDLVTGGWIACSIEASGQDGAVAACIRCDYCDGGSIASCSNRDGGDYCGSGSVTVITCNANGLKDIAGGVVACVCQSDGMKVHNHTCY